jgi:urea transport system substrate-binding protein
MFRTIQAAVGRPNARLWLSAAAGLAFAATGAIQAAKAQDTIKVGILHSLSGTMAISETTLKDTMLFLIDEQNKKGGLLGKKLEAVVVDPASNWPLFAEKARELIAKDKVAAVFGCWTSVSRKSVLPVFKELNSILFYPVQYEGEESERNVFYTGAAPNQQAIPAVDYLMSKDGGSVKRWVLAGTDYVYPRTTNKILEAYLKAKGVKQEDIMINYTPFGHSDWQTIVSDIKKFGSAGKKTAVVSTRRPTFRSWRSRSAKKSSPVSTPSRCSAISPPGTTSSRSRPRPTPNSSRIGRPIPRTRSARPTTRWKPT